MMGEHPSEARLLLALDGELDAQEAARIADHVSGCAECRAAWERFEALSEDVERYCRTGPSEEGPSEERPSELGPSEQVLLVASVATREGNTQHALYGQTTQWQRSWRDRTTSSPSVVLAAAAAVLLMISAWIALARGGSREAPAGEGSAPRTASDTTASGAAPMAAPNMAAPNRAAPPRGHDITLESHTASMSPALTTPASTAPAPTTPASTAPASATPTLMRPVKPHHRLAAAATSARPSTPRQTRPTYYWALPYSDSALPLSEGSVVMRVRLSREQLQLAGIPLAGIPINDSHDTTDRSLVRAKVLVGADGLPRAISFEQD